MSRTLSLSTKAFDPKFYSPVKLEGSETVNQLFSYTLIVKTPDKDNLSSALQDACASADLTSWLGQNIQVAIELDGKNIVMSEVVDTIRQNWNQHVGQGTRYISGMITKAGFLYDQGRSSYYSLLEFVGMV